MMPGNRLLSTPLVKASMLIGLFSSNSAPNASRSFRVAMAQKEKRGGVEICCWPFRVLDSFGERMTASPEES